MATLKEYKGIKVVSPNPTGPGGLAIQNDLKTLADRLASSRYANGLKLAFASATSLTIGPGGAISADGAIDVSITAGLTVRLNATGPNGFDAGGAQPSSVYHVHVIADSTAT